MCWQEGRTKKKCVVSLDSSSFDFTKLCGSGWLLDSDTLYGLARSLPRSSRRYNAENSVEHGAPINTDNPEPGNHWLLKFGSLLKSKLIQVN